MKTTALLILFLVSGYHWSLSQHNTTGLEVGKKISRSIRLGDSDSYALRLDKSQFALIDLKQIGIDLKITTYTPEGDKIEEFDSPNGSDGNEIILVDAPTEGLYEIKVSPLGEEKKIRKGSYEIKLVSINTAVESHLDKVLTTLYERNHIPGFGVSILNAEKLLYQNAMGYAKLLEKVPYTVKTVQNIASISKTFIGLSLMKLVEQGKLDLDTPINGILPFKVINPYFPKKPITIRHLATHTSSINEKGFYYKAYILLEEGASDKYSYHKHFVKELHRAKDNPRITLPEFLEGHLSTTGRDYKKKNFFKVEPGKDWYYSNTGASLAAYIVELVSGEPYKEFVQKNILNPLHLESAVWFGNVDGKFALATQYDSKGNPLPKRTIITYPDGEMYMNVSDLGKYLLGFIKAYASEGNNPLKEMMKVQHEQPTGDFKGRKDGIFWEYARSGVMGHSGGDYGVNAFMYFDPTTHLGFTYMCNIMPRESMYSNAESMSIWAVLKRYAKYIK
ncbi:MAG: serine hydrolase [Flavobacteriaceae bacterium]